MAQLVVRNVDDNVAQLLKARAARNGRSVEAEHRSLLAQALADEPGAAEDFAAAAGRLRARLSKHTDSSAILREARDARFGTADVDRTGG